MDVDEHRACKDEEQQMVMHRAHLQLCEELRMKERMDWDLSKSGSIAVYYQHEQTLATS